MSTLAHFDIDAFDRLVEAGFTRGLGNRSPGQLCVEAAVCMVLGEPHGDQPTCVHPVVRAYVARLNDSKWPDNASRARGVRDLGIAQLGTSDWTDEQIQHWWNLLAEGTIREVVPLALDAAADSAELEGLDVSKLREASRRCREEGTRTSAASASASAYVYASSASASAYVCVYAACVAHAAYAAVDAYAAIDAAVAAATADADVASSALAASAGVALRAFRTVGSPGVAVLAPGDGATPKLDGDPA